MLYQRHFGKGKIVSFIVAFLCTKRAQNVIFHWKHTKKREPPFSRTVPENVFGFL